MQGTLVSLYEVCASVTRGQILIFMGAAKQRTIKGLNLSALFTFPLQPVRNKASSRITLPSVSH